ncbi:hypothetical protein LP420_10170 [Massilia sp. B-10]|nr:hypothetical protein LP420_10170 [Massilia sp. B-10]
MPVARAPWLPGTAAAWGALAIRPRPRVCTRSAPSRTSAACNTRPCTARAAERMAPACNLRLPGERTADAIAACRNSDNTSHLYVAVAWRPVLLWHAAASTMAARSRCCTANYSRASSPCARFRRLSKVVLWALNAQGELFHVSCPQAHAGLRLAAWSHPLCILSGVTAVSPFFDRLHGALVVLARTSDGLIKLVKSPVTGLWNRRSITLPPTSLLQAPLSSASYVTCIRVIDLA